MQCAPEVYASTRQRAASDRAGRRGNETTDPLLILLPDEPSPEKSVVHRSVRHSEEVGLASFTLDGFQTIEESTPRDRNVLPRQGGGLPWAELLSTGGQ